MWQECQEQVQRTGNKIQDIRAYINCDVEVQGKALVGLNTKIIKLHLRGKDFCSYFLEKTIVNKNSKTETISYSFAKIRMERVWEGKKMIVTSLDFGGENGKMWTDSRYISTVEPTEQATELNMWCRKKEKRMDLWQ